MNRHYEKVKLFLEEHPLLPTSLSAGGDFTFALINGILSLTYTSYWFLTLFALYLLLGLMKVSTVTAKNGKRRTEADVMRHNGIAMFGLSIIVCGLMILSIRELRNPSMNKVVMIVVALYTFAFAVMTIRNVVLAHRKKSAVVIVQRNISCVSAIAAILALERAMLGTFGSPDSHFVLMMEACTGVVAFLLVVGIGVGMLIQSWRIQRQ